MRKLIIAFHLGLGGIGFSQVDDSSYLQEDLQLELEEAVVTGTMKEVSKLDSPISVDVISSSYFAKNPAPSLFESIGMVNGVRPQINCSVCNTGDIHINGMEGPYTLVLIDGMPIVSALAGVYGLSGIPTQLIDRVEIVKGPGSSLFGSEAMGGIINVITQDPVKAPSFSLDLMTTSWWEHSADFATKWKFGEHQSLLGVNYFQFDRRVDKNHDNFTDMTLQDRISLFNKWHFKRDENRVGSLAFRYVYEDRWGGELDYDKRIHRGSNEIYGESIFTSRGEFIGMYQLPLKEKIYAQFSYNYHFQDSWYGTVAYKATQHIGFGQFFWDKSLKNHQFLIGTSYRLNYYDDNTVATSNFEGDNEPEKRGVLGVFLQDEIAWNTQHKLLVGYRFDIDETHGGIHSPRIAYKYNSYDRNHAIRGSFGTGFRVVNLFTEDHAALTGSREVVILEELKPERSYNFTINYVWRIPGNEWVVDFDLSGFYSYFTNQITADYDANPNQIIYENLKGHAISKGISLQTNLRFYFPWLISVGLNYMDVFRVEEDEQGNKRKDIPYFAPNWSGNFTISYQFENDWKIDLTGIWNGPMRLPTVPNDYRPEYSPWYLLANVQISKKFANGIELYGGVKNLLNFVPREDPILRSFDPFDEYVNDPISNPYGYTFDTTYNYAPLQGIRGFFGIRYRIL